LAAVCWDPASGLYFRLLLALAKRQRGWHVEMCPSYCWLDVPVPCHRLGWCRLYQFIWKKSASPYFPANPRARQWPCSVSPALFLLYFSPQASAVLLLWLVDRFEKHSNYGVNYFRFSVFIAHLMVVVKRGESCFGAGFRLEGFTHQPPKPPFRPRLPHQKLLDFSKSLKNSKNSPDYREYSKYCEYHIYFSILWR